MLKKWGVLAIGALALAGVVIASASAVRPVAAPSLDLTSRAAVIKYLASHGLETKGIVIQRGTHNYAGARCPGKLWTCTKAKRVVQISSSFNISQFQCTPSSGGSVSSPDDCLIVQFSTNTPNNATCLERIGTATADQSCEIFQKSTTGPNNAYVTQLIDTSAGAVQFGQQYAGVKQESTSGMNTATVSQVLRQSTTTTAPGGSQMQDGFQTSSILQESVNGMNKAQVDQTLALVARASNLPSITQLQNTEDTMGPNTQSAVRQFSGSGMNVANVNQTHDLDATVSRAASGTQQQGVPPGGFLGHFEQDSTGMSTVNGTQRELQRLHADRVPSLTQTQYGPMRWGSDQGSNPADRYIIDQLSTQQAAPSAFQSNAGYESCETSGVCTASQRITQNGQSRANSCSGMLCNIGLELTYAAGSTSSSTCTGSDGDYACPAPLNPPAPPSLSSD